MTVFLQAIVGGLTLAALYVVLSAGLALVFGVLGVVNFAQGDFMTVAAYIGFTAVTAWHMSSLLSIIVMVPVLLVIGVLFHVLVLRPTAGHSDETRFIATFGVAFALQGVVQLAWGGGQKAITLSTAAYQVGGVSIPHASVVRIALAVVVMVGLWLFLSRTKVGRAIHATAESRVAAELLGIDTRRMQLTAVLVSCVLTAGAGYMLLTSSDLVPQVGFGQVFSAFAVVVLAGLGSVGGVVWAGLLLGLASSLTGSYISASATDAVPFIVILVVLLIRPTGLAGKSVA